jgi:2-succinyl-6-hydroxy-2,4-cyclohexadiene-1-carboxylate synthase
MLHGFAQTPASWDATIEKLPAGLTIATPELPGHGKTALTLGDPSPELTRKVVKNAIKEVGAPVVLWGYSQGARAAFDLALQSPKSVAALVIESGAPGIRDSVRRAERRSRDFALSTRIEEGTIEKFVELWESVPALGEQSQAMIDLQRPDRLRNDPLGLAAALRGIGQSAYEPMWEQLVDIKQPTLLITGERDVAYTHHADQMVELIPNVQHAEIPMASHSVHIAQPKLVADAVAEFLAGLS